MPVLTRNTLQGIAATRATTLPSTIQDQLVPGMTFITPAIERRAGTVLFGYDLTPEWTCCFLLARTRSRHAADGADFQFQPKRILTGGYGAEVPEPIDYFNRLD